MAVYGMDILWNQHKMKKLLESFFTLVNIRIGFSDLDGREIMRYPGERSEYCTAIRINEHGDNACRECDKQAFLHAAKLKGPYVYQCHAGLMEIVTPIITPEQEIIGFIMIGQVRQSVSLNESMFKDICKKAKIKNTKKLKSAYQKLPVLKMDQCKACADILQALASNIWYADYFRLSKEPLSKRIKNYVSQNLEKNLQLPDIARQFGVGKTTLCNLVKQETLGTMHDLIRSIRIEKAKQLLVSTELPIYTIAERIGIEDYNYFTKVFKKETGLTPSSFRKQHEGKK